MLKLFVYPDLTTMISLLCRGLQQNAGQATAFSTNTHIVVHTTVRLSRYSLPSLVATVKAEQSLRGSAVNTTTVMFFSSLHDIWPDMSNQFSKGGLCSLEMIPVSLKHNIAGQSHKIVPSTQCFRHIWLFLFESPSKINLCSQYDLMIIMAGAKTLLRECEFAKDPVAYN